MKRKEIKIVFTALDRTILREDNTFSERSLQVLEGRGVLIRFEPCQKESVSSRMIIGICSLRNQ